MMWLQVLLCDSNYKKKKKIFQHTMMWLQVLLCDSNYKKKKKKKNFLAHNDVVTSIAM